MATVEAALAVAARGWCIYPLDAKEKIPAIKDPMSKATTEAEEIRRWWQKFPDANIGFAPGRTGHTVVDIDHGLTDEASLRKFIADRGIPETFAVRTGKRPDFRVQLYFKGTVNSHNGWRDGDCSGDCRGTWGHVAAVGSVHPESGELYEILWDKPVAPMSEWVSKLERLRISKAVDLSAPITEWRNDTLFRQLARLRALGANDSMIEQFAQGINADPDRMPDPLDNAELEYIVGNACKLAVGAPDVEVSIGKTEVDSEPPKDWRERYMTVGTFEAVQPPVFLIDGFLAERSIAMLAGPVAQRKSIIALNIAQALCTGQPLFGFFEVTGCHERVLYLCPEMGAASFVKRIKQIGLAPYIGKTLFVQTMSERPTSLDELDEELSGAVVIVDTIVRFVEGDENKSDDMRKFAQKVFRLASSGATVILLHHSKKGSAGTLDDGLRGSSELAAFVDSCWVTELEDPKRPYDSLSKMRNVKQRDFECDPFKLQPAPGSYVLTMCGEPEPEAVVKSKAEEAAMDSLRKLLEAEPKMGVNKLCAALRAAGHGKGAKWVMSVRASIRGTGATLIS